MDYNKEAEDTLVARKVNKRLYKRFRQKALEEDENVGEALNEAMEYWLDTKQRKTKPEIKNLLKMNGIIKVGKRVKWSEQVDEILYGDRA